MIDVVVAAIAGVAVALCCYCRHRRRCAPCCVDSRCHFGAAAPPAGHASGATAIFAATNDVLQQRHSSVGARSLTILVRAKTALRCAVGMVCCLRFSSGLQVLVSLSQSPPFVFLCLWLSGELFVVVVVAAGAVFRD